MSTPRACPLCGATLPSDAPDGLCPKCLLEALANPPREPGRADLPVGQDAPQRVPTAVQGFNARKIVSENSLPEARSIGPYKLLEEIGEGGMGTVFLAEQTQPVQRKVALKLIKPGMDSGQVIARFEAERQALALMDHPNIAKVFDAGTTESARPYFVMELVKGVPITNYCDTHRLTSRQRLELFIPVCQAVQHAHQKGVIHRDLKPSNVLIAQYDGRPAPKVIDFGVAKATGPKLTERTLFTQFGSVVGTLEYMSPEQAELDALDIDTRSDVYSLGVLLYELLTGTTPLTRQRLQETALLEALRTIREEEPPKPSTRLKQTQLDRLRNQAKSEIRNPKSEIDNDLDWIVMKALEKDRNRRYETANGLAMDIQRHLTHEPVLARPQGRLYRLRKLVRRNKLAFAAATAVAGALVLGAVASAWQAIRATRAEHEQSQLRQQAEAARARAEADQKIAETQAARSRQVARFLKDMLQGVDPGRARGQDTRLLRDILDKTVKRLGNDLKAQPAVEAELRTILSDVYYSLGEFAKSEAMAREAVALQRRLFGLEHPDVAVSLRLLSIALFRQGKSTEAETIVREALAMNKKLHGNEHIEVAMSLNNLAAILGDQGQHDEAEALLREALAIKKKVRGPEHSTVVGSLINLAATLDHRGKHAEAETMLREALALRQKDSGDEPLEAVGAMFNLALVLQNQRKYAEAEALYRQGLAIQKKALGPEHPEVASVLNNLANTLSRQGKYLEAEALHRDALAMRRKLLGPEHPMVARSLNNLALSLVRKGLYPEAEALHREAMAMFMKLLKPEHPDVIDSVYYVADTLQRQGKYGQAEPLWRQLVAQARNRSADKPDKLEVRLDDLAEALYRQTKYSEAEPLYREIHQSRNGRLNAEHEQVLLASGSLGRLLADWAWAERPSKTAIRNPQSAIAERACEAENHLRDTLAVRLRGTNAGHWRVADVQSRLGFALVAVALTDSSLTAEARQSKLAEAESLLLEGRDRLQQSASADRKYKRDALERLVRLYEAWDELSPNTGKAAQAAQWKKALETLKVALPVERTGPE